MKAVFVAGLALSFVACDPKPARGPSPDMLRRATVCAAFCGKASTAIEEQLVAVSESGINTYRYWCTCGDGRQKEVF